MSVCPHVSAWLPLDGYSWNFIHDTFMKMFRQIINFDKKGQEYRALYVKSPYKHWWMTTRSGKMQSNALLLVHCWQRQMQINNTRTSHRRRKTYNRKTLQLRWHGRVRHSSSYANASQYYITSIEPILQPKMDRFVIDACNLILSQQLATKETTDEQNGERNPNTLQLFQHANGQANTVFCV